MDKVIACFLSFLVFAPLQATAADPPPNAAFMLAALRAAREELRSGIAKLEGHLHESSDGKSIVLPWRIYLAFDESRDLYRLDQDLPGRLDGKVAPYVIKYVHTPERSLEWYKGPMGDNGLCLRPPSYGGVMDLRRIDPHSLGLADLVNVDNEFTFSKQMDMLGKEPFEVESMGDGLVRLYCTRAPATPDFEVYLELVLNETQGYAPIRYEHRLFEGGKKPSDTPRATWPKPIFVVETAWQKKNNVWVPTAVQIQNGPESCDLHIEWLEVNTEIPTELFSEEGMRLDNATMVTDLRLGQPVGLGMLSEVLDKRYREEHRVVSRRREYWKYIVIALAVLAVPIVGLWWWRRAR